MVLRHFVNEFIHLYGKYTEMDDCDGKNGMYYT